MSQISKLIDIFQLQLPFLPNVIDIYQLVSIDFQLGFNYFNKILNLLKQK